MEIEKIERSVGIVFKVGTLIVGAAFAWGVNTQKGTHDIQTLKQEIIELKLSQEALRTRTENQEKSTLVISTKLDQMQTVLMEIRTELRDQRR